jgi:3-methyladenine DNA glycosylase AlkD
VLTGFDAAAAAAALHWSLREQGTPERAAGTRAYLKSSLQFTGTPVPAIRATLRAWSRSAGPLTRDELTALVTELWSGQVFECKLAASLLLTSHAALLEAHDIGLVEQLLRSSGTWALVDQLAEHAAGPLATAHPQALAALDRWATDDDFWIRRSAMLALLQPLRRGNGDFDRFARYADAQLDDTEFFIRKVIGWVLRETAKRRPDLVAAWLAPRVHRASGVTVREAVKPLPAGLRERLLAGYRDKRPVRYP